MPPSKVICARKYYKPLQIIELCENYVKIQLTFWLHEIEYNSLLANELGRICGI